MKERRKTMFRKLLLPLLNRRGSVINVALLILVLIFLVGIGLNKISTTDIKIANNMKVATTTFYEAESGLEEGADLLEENIACPTGFYDPDDDGLEVFEGIVMVTDMSFWRRDEAGYPDSEDDGDNTDDDRDPQDNANIVAYYPPDNPLDMDKPFSTYAIGGTTRYAKGSAIQMAAGYEGLGKGSAAGGASILYDVLVKRYGVQNSEALHVIQWIHKIGFAGDCKYGPPHP